MFFQFRYCVCWIKKPLPHALHVIYCRLLLYWFCHFNFETWCKKCVFLRSDIHCVKYAKIWTFSDLFFPVYNSVLTQRSTDRILSIYGKTRIKESPHFGIFFVVIRKKKQFQITFKISQCTLVLSLNKITVFPEGNFCNVIGVKSFIVSFNRLIVASALAFIYKSCFWHNTNLM